MRNLTPIYTMKKVLLAVFIFCIMQVMAGLVTIIPMQMLGIQPSSSSASVLMALAVLISELVTALICGGALKMMEFPATFNVQAVNWKWAMLAIIASVSGIFAGDLLSEILSLPDVMEDMMVSMAHTVWGAAAIAVIGPIAEELLFREGMCGYLMRNGHSTQKAIWVSAILFGIIHFNPAQVPFAILMGLILGVIYAKTGNIVVTSIIHILNNSVAVIEMNVLGDKVWDFSFVEWIGGENVAGICIIAGFTLCFTLLRKFWESSPVPVSLHDVGEL